MTKHFLSSQGKQRDSLSSTVKKQFVAIPRPFRAIIASLLHYYRSFHFTFPKYMQLERLAPPIANNRRISCEEA